MERTGFEPALLEAESWTKGCKEEGVESLVLTPASRAPRAPTPAAARVSPAVLGHKGGCQAPGGEEMRPGNSGRHSGACGPRSSAGEPPARMVGPGPGSHRHLRLGHSRLAPTPG